MNKNVFILLVLIFCFKNIYPQNISSLNGIDSLYMKSIADFYHFADAEKDNVWDGMKMSPVCLYRTDGPAFLFMHPDPPVGFHKIGEKLYIGSQREQKLFGNSQIDLNGVRTAISDYGFGIPQNMDQAFAVLFHEMHHAYQTNYVNTLSPDDMMMLMTYPEDKCNFKKENALRNKQIKNKTYKKVE